MVNFTLKKRGRIKIKLNSNYYQNFSVALLNWEQNLREDKFSFGKLDVRMLRRAKPKAGF